MTNLLIQIALTSGTRYYAVRDTYLSSNLYRGDLVDCPGLTESLPNLFYGVEAAHSIALEMADNRSDSWHDIIAAEEIRGVQVTILDESETVLAVGKISAYTIDESVRLTVELRNDEAFDTLLPAQAVTTDEFTETAADLGAPVPIIFGHAKNVPLANVQNYKPATSTATGTSAGKLVDSAASFTSADVGRYVHNITDSTWAIVTACDSGTQLSLDTDIMESGETYGIRCFDYLVGYGTIESLWVDHAHGYGVKRDGVLVDTDDYTFDDGSGSPTDHGYSGYATIRFKREQVDFGGNFHALHADVKGLELGGSEADRNYANCIKALLNNSTWGLNQSVNAASFTTAAAALPATDFMCDGAVFEQRAARDILDELLFVARSRLTLNSSGEWEITVDGTGSSEATFGDDDGYYNNCTIESVSAEASATAIRNAFVRFDVYEISLAVHSGFGSDKIFETPFVLELTTAKKVLSYIYGRAYYADKKLTMLADSDAADLSPGSVITVTSSRHGLASASYRVLSITKSIDSYRLECEAYNASIFDDQVISDPTEYARVYETHDLQTIDSGYVGGMLVSADTIATTDGLVGLTSVVTGGTDWRIWAGDVDPASAPFRVDETGAVWMTAAHVTGAIEGGTIDIGGSDTTSFHVDINGNMWLGHADYASGPFKVSSTGALTATGVTVTGTITATSGTIGGFTVNTTEGLYAGTGATRVQMKPGSGIWAGAAAIGDAPFSVTQAGTLKATSGTIGGWILGTDLLKSAASGARIELDQAKKRISVIDATEASKVVMGYLNGLARNDGGGNWGAGDYGFWAAAGDRLVIDGDTTYESGDWIVENDGSFLINNAADQTIIRLGTDTGEKGLFLYNAAGTNLAKYITDEVYIGVAGNHLQYTVAGGLVVSGQITVTSGSSGYSNFTDIPNFPSDENLVGYWPFDEGSGAVATDSSGNGNNGTISGSPSWVQGVSGTGLDFAGTAGNQVITCGTTAFNPGLGDFSLCAWIKTAEYADDGGSRRIIAKAVYNGFILYLSSSGLGRVSGYIDGLEVRGDSFVADDEWHFVVCTFDRDGYGTVYVDGIFDREVDISSKVAVDITNATTLTIGAINTNIGRFDGKIDEVRIYSCVLTPNEVLALYLYPGGQKATVIGPTQISTTSLSAISANIGTVTTGVLQSTNWAAGAGAQIDLTNQTIKFGGSSAPKFSVAADGSIAATSGTIGGWTIGSTALANSTNIVLDSSNKKITINNATFANKGIQLEYNAGNPRFYVGDGSSNFLKWDGTTLSSTYNGIVNMKAQGFAWVKFLYDEDIADDETAKVPFNVLIDKTGSEFNTTTNTYTAAQAGKVFIHVHITLEEVLGNEVILEIQVKVGSVTKLYSHAHFVSDT